MNQTNKTKLNPYEKLYNKELSQDKIAEIKSTLNGFFGLLIEIDRENKIVMKE